MSVIHRSSWRYRINKHNFLYYQNSKEVNFVAVKLSVHHSYLLKDCESNSFSSRPILYPMQLHQWLTGSIHDLGWLFYLVLSFCFVLFCFSSIFLIILFISFWKISRQSCTIPALFSFLIKSCVPGFFIKQALPEYLGLENVLERPTTAQSWF